MTKRREEKRIRVSAPRNDRADIEIQTLWLIGDRETN